MTWHHDVGGAGWRASKAGKAWTLYTRAVGASVACLSPLNGRTTIGPLRFWTYETHGVSD